MAIRYRCVGCGAALAADDRDAGRAAGCPECGVASVVPARGRGEGSGRAAGLLIAGAILAPFAWLALAGRDMGRGAIVAASMALLALAAAALGVVALLRAFRGGR